MFKSETVTTSELDSIKTNKPKRTITFNEKDLLTKITNINQIQPVKTSNKKLTTSDWSSHSTNLKPLDVQQQSESSNSLIKSFQEHRMKTNIYPFGNILNNQQQQHHNSKEHLINESFILNTNHTNKFIQSHEKSTSTNAQQTFRLKHNANRTDESHILRKTPTMNSTLRISATPNDLLLSSKQNLSDENREKSFIVKVRLQQTRICERVWIF